MNQEFTLCRHIVHLCLLNSIASFQMWQKATESFHDQAVHKSFQTISFTLFELMIHKIKGSTSLLEEELWT